jgi:hypothetical protein
MARFQLRAAHFYKDRHLKAGTNIADTVGNALAGDFVWVGLSSSTLTIDMAPLDAAATSMRNASAYANIGPSATITGVSSISA